MNDNQKDLVGYLFGVVGYKSDKQLRDLIDNLTLEQSLFFINKSLEYSYSKGIFTMTETELISKSLSILNLNLTENEPPREGPTDNSNN